ncbi:bifunctional lysylphosphatidylglycerol flippase/synthetase MprF [Kineococcus sp. SYSU DK004]|uniref:bifunctional lysylphosphatidylglycerol flippase/synthetase MprF n=1 Tax=Kineococcus sp. SYSU DK004 TaxID=3383125 RepID=UPI003D7D7BC5
MSSPSRPSPGPLRRALAPALVAGLLVAAAVLLHRTFRDLSWEQLGADLLALGPGVVAAALATTAASYVAMTGYDALALRYVEHRLPYRRYGLASFIATAFGNNLGASAVVGAALRARVYSGWQVPGFAITRIIGFNLVTLVLGVAVLAGGGMVHDPAGVGAALRLPAPAVAALGGVLLAAVAGYLLWAFAGRRPIGVRGWRVDRPAPALALAQVALSTVEWLTMAAVLHVLLPAGDRPAFLPFAVAFSIATVAGLVSNVPGGLGVFEATLVVLLGPTTPPADLAVALVAYRLAYFVLPLVLAAALLVVHEARQARAAGRARTVLTPSVLTPSVLTPSVLTPSVLALAAAGAGVFMLLVGDLPGPWSLDLSAVTISLAGLATLLTARGLHRRLKAAWAAAVALLAGVTLVAAAHGDLVLAVVTGGLSLLLVPARPAFHRGTLCVRPRSLVLAGAATALLGAAVWWQESSRAGGPGDAPLLAAPFADGASAVDRLLMAAGTVGVVLLVRWVHRSRALAPHTVDEDQMALVSDIVARSGPCLAQLAFTGDKRFHVSPGGDAFLMYQVEGRSWVVMGDPVGDPDDVPDLVLGFVEEVDRHGGRPVFYNVRAEHAELYRRCGLSLAKLGEEAVVGLEEFTLTGKARVNLRNCRNKSARLGMSVEFVAPGDVEPLLPALREVSDAWLEQRNGKEKRFSLGAFDEDYVRRFPLVVVRQQERVVAFATLWTSADGREVQVDLMRRLPDGPGTVMTFLFVESMLWAKERGFTSFNLGMAPLSGLRTDATAPFWDRIGHLLWTHGEQFYNFKGLRAFKQGFLPEWRTCYVAAPGGPGLPNSMLNVATLVGGGVRGLVRG